MNSMFGIFISLRVISLQEFPVEYLIGWLLITTCSFVGLTLLSIYGSHLEQPALTALCLEPRNRQKANSKNKIKTCISKIVTSNISKSKAIHFVWPLIGEEDGSIYLSSLVAAFKTKDSEAGQPVAVQVSHLRCRFRLRPCCQVPKAVVAALGKHSIKVDTGNLTPATFLYLVDLRCPLHLPVAAYKHLIHIFSEERGEERGFLDFFTTLQCCNLVSLDLRFCHGIPAAAWQKLHGANWPNLKKADFRQRLAERNGWRFSLFFEACICLWWKLFEFRNIVRFVLSQRLFDRLILTKHCRCFCLSPKEADGAADLLQALSHSPLLEALSFYDCSQLPAAAWQKLRGAKWLNLKKANFAGCLAERNGWRFSCFPRGGNLSYESKLTWMGLRWNVYLHFVAFPTSCNRLLLTKHRRCFNKDTQGADGAADLLEALSQSPLLEELDFGDCSQISASSAWQKVRNAKWLNLKKASFWSCLAEWNGWRFSCFLRCAFVSVGCCPSSDLYRFVSLSYESKLTWMGLRWIVYLHLSLSQRFFNRSMLTKHCRCFNKDTQGADGAADLLEALSQSTQLEELNFAVCSQIPELAWQKLRGAKWLNLKKANFAGCLAERNGWRFSCFVRGVYLFPLDVFRVQICEAVVWVGGDLHVL